MAKEYTISDLYQGGYSSLDPSKNLSPTNYPISAGQLGLTTDFRSANIIGEVSSKLSSGAKHVEISPVEPAVFESIPKQHFEEARRAAKLIGASITLHGSPQLEASGITNQGFSESERQGVERQMNNIIDRAHDLNPDGSAPVTFHSSAGIPGEMKEKEKEFPNEILAINTESGSFEKVPIKDSKFPGEEKATIENVISKKNEEFWTSALSHLAFNTERGGETLRHYEAAAIAAEAEKKRGEELTPGQKQAISAFRMGTAFLNDSYRELKGLYEMASKSIEKNGDKRGLQELKELETSISKKVEEINKEKDSAKSFRLRQEIVEEGLEALNKLQAPKISISLNDFAKDRTTDTFANVAWNSYDKFKGEAPIISIENPPAGGAFSTGEELKEIVEKSREKFVKKAIDEGMSKSEARKQAEKLLGVTWDVGHINMLRKYGYDSEDIIKHSEAVAPLVKHVHLSDNFGFEHTELPMGMGNVPIKEIMGKLGKEGFEAKKIVEAGHWWQHFSEKGGSPLQPTLEAFGSPLYSMQMAPSWNQAQAFQQSYYSGLGEIFPNVNYQTFGATFSQLPMELGGQQPGAGGSRVSGRGME